MSNNANLSIKTPDELAKIASEERKDKISGEMASVSTADKLTLLENEVKELGVALNEFIKNASAKKLYPGDHEMILLTYLYSLQNTLLLANDFKLNKDTKKFKEFQSSLKTSIQNVGAIQDFIVKRQIPNWSKESKSWNFAKVGKGVAHVVGQKLSVTDKKTKGGKPVEGEDDTGGLVDSLNNSAGASAAFHSNPDSGEGIQPMGATEDPYHPSRIDTSIQDMGESEFLKMFEGVSSDIFSGEKGYQDMMRFLSTGNIKRKIFVCTLFLMKPKRWMVEMKVGKTGDSKGRLDERVIQFLPMHLMKPDKDNEPGYQSGTGFDLVNMTMVKRVGLTALEILFDDPGLNKHAIQWKSKVAKKPSKLTKEDGFINGMKDKTGEIWLDMIRKFNANQAFWDNAETKAVFLRAR